MGAGLYLSTFEYLTLVSIWTKETLHSSMLRFSVNNKTVRGQNTPPSRPPCEYLANLYSIL